MERLAERLAERLVERLAERLVKRLAERRRLPLVSRPQGIRGLLIRGLERPARRWVTVRQGAAERVIPGLWLHPKS